MAADEVKLVNMWPSMFGIRVLIALHEKGVEYEYIEENLFNRSQLLLQSNPVHKKIPVLIHNGKPICESLIIVQYIDEAWPSHDVSFVPSDPYERSITRFWADYVEKKMYDAGARIMRSPEGYAREQGKKDMKECVATLDRALRDVFGGGGPYFGGEKMGLVDIALAPFLAWFEAYEALGQFKLLEEEMCPHLSKWAKVVVEQPSVKRATSIAPPCKVLEFAQMMRKRALARLAS